MLSDDIFMNDLFMYKRSIIARSYLYIDTLTILYLQKNVSQEEIEEDQTPADHTSLIIETSTSRDTTDVSSFINLSSESYAKVRKRYTEQFDF